MPMQPVSAGTVPVIAVLRDIATGAVVTEHPLQPGETQDFFISDGVMLDADPWDGSAESLRARYQSDVAGTLA